jgi:hypothetical protein
VQILIQQCRFIEALDVASSIPYYHVLFKIQLSDKINHILFHQRQKAYLEKGHTDAAIHIA